MKQNTAAAAQIPTPDAQAIAHALPILRPQGNLQLVAIHPTETTAKGDAVIHAATFNMPAQASEATTWATTSNANGFNLYFGTNPLRQLATTKASRDNVAQIELAHLDADPDLTNGYAAGRADLLNGQLTELKTSASLIIDSGNGLQAFYRYARPLPAEKNGLGETINRQLIAKHRGDRSAFDCSHIMRLPGTLNYPTPTKINKGYPAEPSMARLLHHDPTKVYDAAELAKWLPKVPPKAQTHTKPFNEDETPLTGEEEAYTRKRLEQLQTWQLFADRWAGKPRQPTETKPNPDNSRSGFDMSIAAMSKGAGLSYRQTRYVLQELFQHGKGPELTDRELHNMWTNTTAEPPPDASGLFGDIGTQQDADWPDPDPLPLITDAPLPKWMPELFPKLWADYAEEVGHEMGVDPAGVAHSMGAAFFSCLDSRLEFQPRPMYAPKFKVKPRVGTCIVDTSGGNKTGVYAAVFDPLIEMQKEYNTTFIAQMAAYEQAMNRFERQDRDPQPNEVASPDDTPAPVRPVKLRLLVSGGTLEGIRDLMTERPRGMAWIRDELAKTLATPGDNGSDREGAQAMLIDMMDGKHVYTALVSGDREHECALGIHGNAQWAVLSKFLQQQEPNGLIERFLFVMPRRIDLPEEPVSTPEFLSQQGAYQRQLRYMLMQGGEPWAFRSSPEAEKLIYQFHRKWRKVFYDMRDCEIDDPMFTGTIGKATHFATRYALLLHFFIKKPTRVVSAETMQQAIDLVELFFLPHNQYFFERVYQREGMVRKVLFRIMAKADDWGDSFTASDVKRTLPREFHGATYEQTQKVAAVMAVLEKAQVVREQPAARADQKRWQVNPKIHHPEYADLMHKAKAVYEAKLAIREQIRQKNHV